MGKKNHRKRKYKDANYSNIQDHHKVGKQLISPLNNLPGISTFSWRNDYAPDMLWAFLLAIAMPREIYLACFREIIVWWRETFFHDDKPLITGNSATPIDDNCEGDHVSLAQLSRVDFEQFVKIILKYSPGYKALRPLRLLESLPGVAHWRTVINVEPLDSDWEILGQATIPMLDDQSEISTDIRWLKSLLAIVMGKVLFPEHLKEEAEEIMEFPNKGDMRQVRPSIRSLEMAVRRNPPSPWIEEYWAELFTKTKCIDGSSKTEYCKFTAPVLACHTISLLRGQLAHRFREVTSSTRTDAKLDAAFGFCLYALSLLEEMAAPPMPQMILGRMGLRSIAEIAITFSYLLKKDNTDLWRAYRNFGTGQAKLAFLKLEQQTGDAPTFIEQEILYQLANEDSWQEFVNVNLGHWEGKNLRDLALASGTKEDIYDKYYDWTSTFSHAHWCAVRDTNFMTCQNPLHRLHRIPRPYHRLMPNVVEDAVKLVNQIFGLLESTFPEMEKLERVVALPLSN